MKPIVLANLHGWDFVTEYKQIPVAEDETDEKRIRKIVKEVGNLREKKKAERAKAAFIMYATGGGRGFFFQRLVFLYPPPRSIQIFRTPQAISRKINTPPLPPPPSQEISK